MRFQCPVSKAILDDDGEEGIETCVESLVRHMPIRKIVLTVKRRNDTELQRSMDPSLDIFRRNSDIFPRKLSRSAAVLVHYRRSVSANLFIVVVQKAGLLVGTRHQEEADDTEDNGDYAFDNIDPETPISSFSGAYRNKGGAMHTNASQRSRRRRPYGR